MAMIAIGYKIVSVAPLFAKAIDSIVSAKSISSLFCPAH